MSTTNAATPSSSLPMRSEGDDALAFLTGVQNPANPAAGTLGSIKLLSSIIKLSKDQTVPKEFRDLAEYDLFFIRQGARAVTTDVRWRSHLPGGMDGAMRAALAFKQAAEQQQYREMTKDYIRDIPGLPGSLKPVEKKDDGLSRS